MEPDVPCTLSLDGALREVFDYSMPDPGICDIEGKCCLDIAELLKCVQPCHWLSLS